MFELKEATVKLANLNLRAEIHGDETVLAADLKIELKGGNDILNILEPGLMEALYRAKEEADSGQGDMLAGQPGYMPVIRFPLLGQPVKWEKEFAGYTFRMHYGIDDTSDIILRTCSVDNFKFDCQDGGTVVTTFRVIAHPDSDHEIGLLGKNIQQQITLSLTPPDADDLYQQQQKAMDEVAG